MSELTKEQVQRTATLIVKAMQATIDSLNKDVGLLETSLADATDRIEELTAEIKALKEQIARIGMGKGRTIYPWATQENWKEECNQ